MILEKVSTRPNRNVVAAYLSPLYGKIMKYMLSIIVLIILAGCSPDHTYKYYEFTNPSFDTGIGTIKVGLRGEFVLVDSSKKMKITHKGNPYEFWVWFQTDDEKVERINISNIEIIYKNGELVKEHKGGAITLKWSDNSNSYFGGWYFKNLELKHQPLHVNLTASIETENGKVLKSFTFELNTKYKEEKANNFWSMLMSV